MKERLIGLFEEHFGHRPDVILDLAADGSTRQYFRLAWGDAQTAVGAIGPDREENRAFLSFAKAFRDIGLPVPEIYAGDREAGVWLEEDLGDTTLFKAPLARPGSSAARTSSRPTSSICTAACSRSCRGFRCSATV